MASWAEFERSNPDMASFGLQRLTQRGVPLAFLATVRSDGGPRVHPVCPILGGGRVFVAVPPESPKQRDLRRDPRYMLHTFPGEQDPEFSMRGRAREVTDSPTRELARASVAFAAGVRDDDALFELDIERADTTVWENWAQADTRPVRRRWLAPPQ